MPPPTPKSRLVPEIKPTLVSVDSLRQTHGLTSKRVYALLKPPPEIASVLIGRRRFIVLASVDAYVARLLAEPSATSFRQSPNPHATRRRSRRQAHA
jgi:hypothetical protein